MHTLSLPQTEHKGRDGRTVTERAENLFSDGYTCSVSSMIGINVTSPEGRRYNADPREHLCTCPAFSNHFAALPCKHQRGGLRLAMQQADAHCWKAVEIGMAANACQDRAQKAALLTEEARLYNAAAELYDWIERQEAGIRRDQIARAA